MPVKKETVNLVIIVVGICFLMYSLALKDSPVYIKIAGVVLLMYGLFTMSRQSKKSSGEPNESDG